MAVDDITRRINLILAYHQCARLQRRAEQLESALELILCYCDHHAELGVDDVLFRQLVRDAARAAKDGDGAD